MERGIRLRQGDQDDVDDVWSNCVCGRPDGTLKPRGNDVKFIVKEWRG